MRSWLPAVVLMTLASGLYAQPPGRMPPMGPQFLSREYLTATVLPRPDTTLLQVEILFRCSATSLVALKSDEPGAPYLRKGDLTIELFDSSRTSRARELERIELPAPNPDTSEFPITWIERRASFLLPRGRYVVRAELQDLQSGNRLQRETPLFHPSSGRDESGGDIRRPARDDMRRAQDEWREPPPMPPPPGGDSLRVLPVFFTLGVPPPTGDTLRPQNYGDGVLFAAEGSLLLYLPEIDPAVRSADVTVRFMVADPGEKKPELLREEKFPRVQLRSGRALTPVGTIEYALTSAPGRTHGAFLLLPLPLEQLPLRRYSIELECSAGSRHGIARVNALMLWPDQPESLRDVAYALESLRFIVTGHALDSLRSGSFADHRKNLEAFWKARDATPATADNPLMTEYYRRVDHARESFATLKQNDGTRTDRGKIYILNGPPSRTDRTLDPVNGFSETWTYERSGKRFVFVDKSRDGNYTLLGTGAE